MSGLQAVLGSSGSTDMKPKKQLRDDHMVVSPRAATTESNLVLVNPDVHGSTKAKGLWFSVFDKKIRALSQLSKDWDSYGAEAPNGKATYWAGRVLSELRDLGLTPTSILPSVEGGIGITFRRDGKYADIECFNTGEILAIQSDGSGQPSAWEVGPDALKETLAKIRAYLNA